MHNMTGRCHAGIVADGHLVSARIPVGSHHAVDTFCLGHCMMVGSMTADSERAGLYYGTIGMVAGAASMPVSLWLQSILSPPKHPSAMF